MTPEESYEKYPTLHGMTFKEIADLAADVYGEDEELYFACSAILEEMNYGVSH